MKAMNYSPTLTVVTMYCLAALALARENDVKVNKDLVKGAIKYLQDVSPGGAPAYSPDMPYATVPQSSSRAAAMMAFFPALRDADDAFVQSLLRHSRKGFESLTIDSPDPHPYANYRLAAVGLYRQGDEARAESAKLRNRILAPQKDDGHWESSKETALVYGGSVFTASYAPILAVPLEFLPLGRRQR